MSNSELQDKIREEIQQVNEQEKEAWDKIHGTENAIVGDTEKYRAMFVVQWCVSRRNAALALADKLMQIEAQTKAAQGAFRM